FISLTLKPAAKLKSSTASEKSPSRRGLADQIRTSLKMKHFPQILINTASAVVLITSLSACANMRKKGAGGTGADSDFVSGTPLSERQEGVSFMSDNVDKSKFSPVHFAFDSYAVDAGDEGKLDEVAAFLKGNANTIIVAGFTDERGTPEYNRGLG